MKIGVLTSSRADYGVYFPLLQKIEADSSFTLEVIAFGTHLSKSNGYTLTDIKSNNHSKIHTISSLISNDDAESIASSYALTALKFADFWAKNTYDIVFCLGDRFEMNAAVQAGIPFGIRFAHLYGGETTLGAMDEIYRHQITLASKIHFTATEDYKRKIYNILGSDHNVFAIGSLSLDEVKEFNPIEKNVFYEKFNLIENDFALVTFHPETIAFNENINFANEMKIALGEIAEALILVITMPNADTLGTEYRKKIEELKAENPKRVLLIENFGKVNYFSAMSYARLLIGNTSSGIIEAASFGKYVVNVGDRQKGRAQSQNILDSKFTANDILDKTNMALSLGEYSGENIYYKKNVADNIITILKTL